MSALEQKIDELYALPLAEFTAARNTLAKSLKGDDAARVKRLEKPSIVAWSVNQLYWVERRTFERLMTAGKALRSAQIAALKWLNQSAEKLQDQYQEINTMLEKQVTEQHDRLIQAFESNMASTVEHYILEALGDQFDMKAQMPGIIKQLADNKQAMVDDIKL